MGRLRLRAAPQRVTGSYGMRRCWNRTCVRRSARRPGSGKDREDTTCPCWGGGPSHRWLQAPHGRNGCSQEFAIVWLLSVASPRGRGHQTREGNNLDRHYRIALARQQRGNHGIDRLASMIQTLALTTRGQLDARAGPLLARRPCGREARSPRRADHPCTPAAAARQAEPAPIEGNTRPDPRPRSCRGG